MSPKAQRPRLSPAQRAARCAAHRAATSPGDAESFRLMAELIHGLEDLTTLVENLTSSVATLQASVGVHGEVLAAIKARIG